MSSANSSLERQLSGLTSPAAAHRRLLVVRDLSCESNVHRGSPVVRCSPNHRGSPRQGTPSPRVPLFPLPPAIEAPSSFDSDDELSNSCRHKAKIKRVRSFGSVSRQPSMLGPSRGSPAPPVSGGGVRPPPIRTIASLEGFGGQSLEQAMMASGSGFGPPPLVVRTSSAWSECSLPDLSASQPQPTPRVPPGGRHGFAPVGRSSAPPMSLVAPGLYVGDETAAASIDGLAAAGVTHVLNCTCLANVSEGQPGAPAHYLQLGLLDSTADLPRMATVLAVGADFIENAHRAGGTVLVHCHRGISRSATLAMAYLVRTTQQPAEAIFEQMRTHRPIIDPNLAYWMALKEWERRTLPAALLRGRSTTPGSAAGRATPGSVPGGPATSSPRSVFRQPSFGAAPRAMTPPPPVRPSSRAL